MTTMIDWRESKLNPDAPVFDPVEFREVEDFSPRWWELVTTSKWFRDFWLSVNSEYEFGGEDLSDMEDFEEVIVSSEEDKNGGSTDDTVIESDVTRYLKAVLKLLTMVESMKGKVKRSKVAINSCSPKYNKKKTNNKYMNPNFNCRRNHQIYQPR